MSVDGQIRAIIEREKGAAVRSVRGGADTSRDTLKKLSESLDSAVGALTNTDPPDAPAGLVGDTFVEVGKDGAARPRLSASWAPNPVPGLAYYVLEVARDDGDPVAHNLTATAWEQAAKEASTYRLSVTAVDVRGNHSQPSEPVVVSPDGDLVPPGDVVPATPPIRQKAGALVLKGQVPDDVDFDHIEVWRDDDPGAGDAVMIGVKKAFPFRDDEVAIGDTWYYWARAVDRSGNKSALVGFSSATVIDVNDTVAPAAPVLDAPTQTIAFDSDGHQVATVALTWAMATEPDFKRYDVGVNKDGKGWHVRALTPEPTDAPRIEVEARVGQTVAFKVIAVDASNNKSAKATASLTVSADTTAPGPVTGATATAKPKGVVLKATAPAGAADADFAGVQVYRNDANDAAGADPLDLVPGRKGHKFKYVDDDVLTISQPYWYWMASVDSQGNESATRVGVEGPNLDDSVTWAGVQESDIEDNAVDLAGAKVTGKSLANVDATAASRLGAAYSPARNLIKNPTFKHGAKGHTLSFGATVIKNSAFGNYTGGVFSSGNDWYFSPIIPVTTGQPYSAQLSGMTSGGSFEFYIQWYADVVGTMIVGFSATRLVNVQNGTFNPYLLENQPAPAGATYARLRATAIGIGSGNYFIQSVKVERGPVCTPFSDDYTPYANYDNGDDIEALKPGEAGATKAITYRQPAPPTGGAYSIRDRWIDTSSTPRVHYAWTGTAWEAIGRNVTKTSETDDDAGLGATAMWTGVSGSGKPVDGATRNITYRQASAPSGGTYTTGDTWIDTSAAPRLHSMWTGSAWEAIGRNVTDTNQIADGGGLGTKALWASVTGAGKPADNATHNTGALANQNTVGVGDIDANAVDSAQIKAAAVGTGHLASGAVTGAKVAASTLSDSHLNASAGISFSKMQDTRVQIALSSAGRANSVKNLPNALLSTSAAPISGGSPVSATSAGVISVASHTRNTDGGNIAYNAGTISGAGASGTTYYVWANDANLSGGVVTYTKTTTYGANITNSNFIYIDFVTIPSSGSAGGGGGGFGYCVSAQAFLPDGRRAQACRAGDLIEVLDLDGEGSGPCPVAGVEAATSACVRLTTASGISLTCSVATPITTREDPAAPTPTLRAPDCLGHEVPVRDAEGLRWEAVVEVERLPEPLPVARIHVDGRTYAAGDQPGRFIFTHNPAKP